MKQSEIWEQAGQQAIEGWLAGNEKGKNQAQQKGETMNLDKASGVITMPTMTKEQFEAFRYGWETCNAFHQLAIWTPVEIKYDKPGIFKNTSIAKVVRLEIENQEQQLCSACGVPKVDVK